MDNQLQAFKITLQYINFQYAILYIGLIIILVFDILELKQDSQYNPIGQNLDTQPIMQISLQDNCDQDQETISYKIQSTVIGCYCQGNKRYSCTQLQIKEQGCIPIESSTGTSLSYIPIQPKSKQFRGIELCVRKYKGPNQRQQIEKNFILQAKDCTGDYKICGNQTSFFCIHKNETSCPIGNFIFSNTALQNPNFILVNNISNTYFLYVENNQTQFIADIQLIDGQGVCLDRNQISLSENKSSYELDLIPASNCTIDETYQKYIEYYYQIFAQVNNFSFSQYNKQIKPFYEEEQSNIKMHTQRLQYASEQCRHEIHNYLQNKDMIILKFQFLLYFQLIILFLPIIQLWKNNQIRFVYVIMTYAIVLGLGIWQTQSLFEYKKNLNSMCDICQFQKQEDILNQSIIYQLILIAMVILILIPTYQVYKTQLSQLLNEGQELPQADVLIQDQEQAQGQAQENNQGQVQQQVDGQAQVQVQGQVQGQAQAQHQFQTIKQKQQKDNNQTLTIYYNTFTDSAQSQTFRPVDLQSN